MLNINQSRLGVNLVLTDLFLGLAQGGMTAKDLFPALPMSLRGMTLPQMGNERLRRYDLNRAPGSDTRRIDIHWQGVTYSVIQKAVDIPIPRENMDEASNASKQFGIAGNLDMSKTALMTAQAVLDLDYELDVAAIATLPTTYAAGNVLALAGATKWSAATGTPVVDILTARRTIRQKIGINPNILHLSAIAWDSLQTNPQVISYMSANNLRLLDLPNAQRLFQVEKIVIGDAVWENSAGVIADVWGNNAILAFAPKVGDNSMDLGQPAFGTTNVLKGHPFVETPYYDPEAKTWVYGVTYERAPQIGYNGGGFLFQNPF